MNQVRRRWNRRRFIRDASLITAASPFLASCASQPVNGGIFQHGVASGDPLKDRVIIWTRVSSVVEAYADVDWLVSSSEDFGDTVAAGSQRTGLDTDFTVNVDVSNLSPGTRYFYRFSVAGEISATGTTRTLPSGEVSAINLAVVSCSNYPAGYFNVYGAIAGMTDIDAVLHLGDYIYEYGAVGYQTENAAALGRVPDPEHETLSLGDYRTRFAQYRTDNDLQAMHAAHPMIAVWDDHEFANNSSMHGAQNHSGDEGDWLTRQRAAAQAYREWVPMRQNPIGNSIYRSFDFGNLATVAMLDTRIDGRDPIPTMESLQKPSAEDAELSAAERARQFQSAVLDDPSRTLLGDKQAHWLRGELRRSANRNVPWQIIGQQIVMGGIIAPDLRSFVSDEKLAGMKAGLRRILKGVLALGKLQLPMNLDTWDGYAAARDRLYADLHEYANNTIVLSGDSHSAGASDLIDRNGSQVGVEFAVTSVTSSGFGAYFSSTPPEQLHAQFQERNPHLRYVNVYNNGFCICRVTPESVRNNWYVVSTTASTDYTVSLDNEMTVDRIDGPGTAALRQV